MHSDGGNQKNRSNSEQTSLCKIMLSQLSLASSFKTYATMEFQRVGAATVEDLFPAFTQCTWGGGGEREEREKYMLLQPFQGR